MERGEQDPAVGQGKVQVLLYIVVSCRGRFGAGPRCRAGKAVLRSCSELHDAPRQVMTVKGCLYPFCESGGEVNHLLERLGGKDLAQRGPSRGERQRIAGQGAAHSADIDQVRVAGLDGNLESRRHLGGEPVGANRDTACERLAQGHQVGPQAPGQGAATGAGRQSVGFVDQQQRAGPVTNLAESVEEPRFGQDDANVR